MRKKRKHVERRPQNHEQIELPGTLESRETLWQPFSTLGRSYPPSNVVGLQLPSSLANRIGSLCYACREPVPRPQALEEGVLGHVVQLSRQVAWRKRRQREGRLGFPAPSARLILTGAFSRREGGGLVKMAAAALLLVFPSPLPRIQGFLRSCWSQLGCRSPPGAPALAIQGPAFLPEPTEENAESKETPSFLDSIFWMAAPKSRRTIEVNRCRRRNPRNLIKIKRNIDVCPQCGNLKLKHILCGYCYAKVKRETVAIRKEIWAQEGGPHKAPPVETVVLYEGEKARDEDEGKRIIERTRKRPSWFTQD
uniref:Large ribosomal subunit protein bL32m n=1 Tax=Podarcis muralis TaxID=64176 RepID=A0A670JKE8_PODMU|nr:39S ribosomal protein L32, mitochondrial-like [Podarcis muralis]